MALFLSSTGLPLISPGGLLATTAAAPGGGTWDTSALQTAPSNGSGGYTIASGGATYTFSTPVQYFESANGDFIVPTQAAAEGSYLGFSGTTITSVSPAGATSANGYDYNGLVENPEYGTAPGVNTQGWEEAAGVDFASQFYPYNTALNVDPAKTGSAITINAGAGKTFVKAIRSASVNDANASSTWKFIEEYCPIHFMPTLPSRPGTWFAPSWSETTKTYPPRTLEEMDIDSLSAPPQLRDLVKPSQVPWPSATLAEMATRKTRISPKMIDTVSGRRLQLTGETASSGGYSLDIGRLHGRYMCGLFLDPDAAGNPTTERAARKELAAVLIQWGINGLGSAWGGGTGAGQFHGYLPMMYLAAFMHQSAAWLARAQAMVANVTDQYFWIQQRDIGADGKWSWDTAGSNSYMAGRPVQVEHLGKPEWIHQGPGTYDVDATDLSVLPAGSYDEIDSAPNSPYKGTSSFSVPIDEGFPIYMLRNGPGGETGYSATLRGSATVGVGGKNVTAALPRLDLNWTHNPVGQTFNQHHGWESTPTYTAWRDLIEDSAGNIVPRFTFAPDIFANQYLWPNFVGTADATRHSLTAPGSGEVRFQTSQDSPVTFADFTTDYSTETITDRDWQISLSGVDWFDPVVLNAANTLGSGDTAKTMVGVRPGTTVRCRWRQRSASGWSPWSEAWCQSHEAPGLGSGFVNVVEDRGKVFSGGATPSSGSPTLVSAPKIMYKPYPLHEAPEYNEAPAALSGASVYQGDATNYGTYAVGRLYCGVGLWSGGSGDFGYDYALYNYDAVTVTGISTTWQWQRNIGGGWGNISGATDFHLDITSESTGAQLRCNVTVGGVLATSNSVTK